MQVLSACFMMQHGMTATSPSALWSSLPNLLANGTRHTLHTFDMFDSCRANLSRIFAMDIPALATSEDGLSCNFKQHSCDTEAKTDKPWVRLGSLLAVRALPKKVLPPAYCADICPAAGRWSDEARGDHLCQFLGKTGRQCILQ